MLSMTVWASAQPRRVGSIYDVKGTGTVTRPGEAARPLTVTADVFAGEALAQLRERSAMVITEDAGRPVLNLNNGSVYYRVSRTVRGGVLGTIF